MRRLLYLAVALGWLVGCGGQPKALREAEDALDRGDYAKAERAYGRAAREYLTPREREQVKAGRKRIAEAKVRERIRAAAAQPGRDGLKALAEVRKWFWRNGGEARSPGDKAVVKAIAQRIEALWPAAEAPKTKGHFIGALDGVSALVAVLGRDAPKALQQRRQALVDAAKAAHGDRAGPAVPLGARALHQGILARLGGSQPLEALKALRAEQTIGVTVSAGPDGQAQFAGAIARGAGTSGQIKVTGTVQITGVQTSSRPRTYQEPYAWVEKVPYQVTERVRVGSRRVLVKAKTCSNKSTQLRPNGRGGYDKYEVTNSWDCSVYQSRDQFEDRVVTKYRDERRQGVRQVTEETNRVAVSGRATLRFDGAAPFTVDLGLSKAAKDTRYRTPQGSKGIAPKNTVAGLSRAARDVLSKRVRDRAVAAVRAQRSAAWLAEAETADRVTAEDRDVRAILMRGVVPKPSAARLEAAYGIKPPAVLAVLEGKAPRYAEAAWRATAADRRQAVGKAVRLDDMAGEGILERGYTIGTGGFGLSRWSTPGLPVQTPREAYGMTIRMDYPVLSAALDMREGLVFQDNFLFELSAGGRTSDAAPYTGSQEESPLAFGARLGYQAQVGYRGSYLGLLAGVRSEGIYTRLGDFQARDSVHCLVGTLEVKFWDRNPMVFQAYGLPFWGDGDVLGGSFDVTLGGTNGLGLRLERWTLEARYGGNAPKDVIGLGKQQVLSADLMYLFRF